MTERTTVVLVDEQGRPTAIADKVAAHRAPGMLHHAFSVFVFSPQGDLLLQRRSLAKYHFPGVWANTCCSHPAPGEDVVESAERRLAEELGLRRADRSGPPVGTPAGAGSGSRAGSGEDNGEGEDGDNDDGEGELVLLGALARAGRFVYRAECGESGLVEHELDEVLVGRAGPAPLLPPFDPSEVDELRWATLDEVRGAGEEQGFAPWFAEALELAIAAI
jgi:isopentenyl-diphosphate Delta-isomerase